MNTVHRLLTPCRLLTATCLLGIAVLSPAKGDIVQLVNGDRYSGEVLSVSLTNVVLKSEIQGSVVLPRDKVANIVFREVTEAAAVDAVRPNRETGAPSDVVRQMRESGVDPGVLKAIQDQFPGVATPEANRMFHEMVTGLRTGAIDLGDIRRQAREAVKDIETAKRDLGPDAGELLDGYLSILENFLKHTGEAAANEPESEDATAEPDR